MFPFFFDHNMNIELFKKYKNMLELRAEELGVN